MLNSVILNENSSGFSHSADTEYRYHWLGDLEEIGFDTPQMLQRLLQLDQPLYAVETNNRLGLANHGRIHNAATENESLIHLQALVPPVTPQSLGNDSFRQCYGTSYACYAGAMAHGIASEEMVISMGRGGFLASYGAAGLLPARLEEAILRLQQGLQGKPFAINLIHSPNEPALESQAVDLFLKHQVNIVEASAFLDLSAALVRFRALGLEEKADGSVEIHHHLIAKLSRTEVAAKFMSPAPSKILNELLVTGQINEQQHRLAQRVPLADDITVEADSGGHTDNRPLVCLLPTMLALRDELQQQYRYAQPVRIGAAGGISTPQAALAAFSMGADYIATGSVNQACIEAGTSDYVRHLLAEAGMADVLMAPSADMFEMGVKVQVLKKGSLFPMRAQKLYDLYTKFDSIDEIPADERQKIEKTIFQNSLQTVWEETVNFFKERNPQQIQQAEKNPKRKMALIFRWYLGQSSRWANTGVAGREMDYQIWCGPSMGTFNDWTRGTYLENQEMRHVVDVNRQILLGCAYQQRIQSLLMQGVRLPLHLQYYRPQQSKSPSITETNS